MKSILVIDDEAQVRTVFQRMLERAGYRVVLAADGAQGLRCYKAEAPDLVITDLVMPGKEGIETIREIKSLNPAARILAVSGGGRNDPGTYLKLAQKLGATRTLSKPVERDRLLETVASLLAEDG